MILTLVPSILLFTDGYAQSVTPGLLSADGGSFSNAAFSISYAAGEPIVETESGTDFMFTQGFLQDTILVTSVKRIVLSSVSYYPNPFAESFYIELDDAAELSVFNLTGQLGSLLVKLTGGHHEISSGDLAAGVYSVRIHYPNGEQRNFRIEKFN